MELSNTQKDRQHHALATYGNYRNYYFHRTPTIPDARLSLLKPSLFKGKRVLDLGCNAGKLTIEAVLHLDASSSFGIDIDDVLVEQAKTLGAEVKNCDFVCADFMQDSEKYFGELQGGPYNTVLLLSITKWLHLHHGDEGLKKLMTALYALLPPQGILVVEPQEWDNYKQAVRKNKSLKPMFKTLELRPPFEDLMTSVGFALEEMVEREEGGFSRPLMVWRKA